MRTANDQDMTYKEKVAAAKPYLEDLTKIFFNDTASTEFYTLSLHDALPIYFAARVGGPGQFQDHLFESSKLVLSASQDRKSTRLNSSHGSISYAVFCLQ